MQIRRARPEEAAALSALIYRSKQSNGYDDAFMAACADELRVSAGDIDTGLIWVAEADRLVACVTLLPLGDTGEVSAFFVDPSAKRQGVGKRLWQVVLEAALNRGIRRLTLDADPEAVAFYEAMGFETVGTSPSGSIPDRVLPQMARDIAAS